MNLIGFCFCFMFFVFLFNFFYFCIILCVTTWNTELLDLLCSTRINPRALTLVTFPCDSLFTLFLAKRTFTSSPSIYRALWQHENRKRDRFDVKLILSFWFAGIAFVCHPSWICMCVPSWGRGRWRSAMWRNGLKRNFRMSFRQEF